LAAQTAAPRSPGFSQVSSTQPQAQMLHQIFGSQSTGLDSSSRFNSAPQPLLSPLPLYSLHSQDQSQFYQPISMQQYSSIPHSNYYSLSVDPHQQRYQQAAPEVYLHQQQPSAFSPSSLSAVHSQSVTQ